MDDKSFDEPDKEISHLCALLHESDERFEDFSGIAVDRFWETDDDHRFTYVSPPKDAPLFLGHEKVMGKARWELQGADPNNEKWRAYRATMDAHQPFRDFRSSQLDGTGRTRHLRASGNPYFRTTASFRVTGEPWWMRLPKWRQGKPPS